METISKIIGSLYSKEPNEESSSSHSTDSPPGSPAGRSAGRRSKAFPLDDSDDEGIISTIMKKGNGKDKSKDSEEQEETLANVKVKKTGKSKATNHTDEETGECSDSDASTISASTYLEKLDLSPKSGGTADVSKTTDKVGSTNEILRPEDVETLSKHESSGSTNHGSKRVIEKPVNGSEMPQNSDNIKQGQDAGQDAHQDARQDARQETRQDARQETHQGAHQETHQDAHQDARQETHQGARQETHQDAHQDVNQGAHQDAHQGALQDARQETHQGARQETHQDAHQDVNQGAHQDAHQGALQGARQDVRHPMEGPVIGTVIEPTVTATYTEIIEEYYYGDDEADYSSAREEVDYHSERDEVDHHSERDEVDYHSGREEVDCRSGLEEVDHHSERNELDRHSERDDSEIQSEMEEAVEETKPVGFIDLDETTQRTILELVMPMGLKLYPFAGMPKSGDNASENIIKLKTAINIIQALCQRKDPEILLSGELARNILYGQNNFTIVQTSCVISFVGTVGIANLTRVNFQNGVTFEPRIFAVEMGTRDFMWLQRWKPELRKLMRGESLFQDIVQCYMDNMFTINPIVNAAKAMFHVWELEQKVASIVSEREAESANGNPRIASVGFAKEYEKTQEELNVWLVRAGLS